MNEEEIFGMEEKKETFRNQLSEEVRQMVVPDDRLPCVFLFDISSSMVGRYIAQIFQGFGKFSVDVLDDEQIKRKLDVAIITYNDTAQVTQGFVPVTSCVLPAKDDPRYQPGGTTAMGEAVELGMQVLQEHYKDLKLRGVTPYKGFIANFSDGEPNGCPQAWDRACKLITENIELGYLSMFNFGVDQTNFSKLSEFKGSHCAKVLESDFAKAFEWIKDSIRIISQSAPGDNIQLAPTQDFFSAGYIA